MPHAADSCILQAETTWALRFTLELVRVAPGPESQYVLRTELSELGIPDRFHMSVKEPYIGV